MSEMDENVLLNVVDVLDEIETAEQVRRPNPDDCFINAALIVVMDVSSSSEDMRPRSSSFTKPPKHLAKAAVFGLLAKGKL